MAWNGAGVFNRLYNWVSDAGAGIKIASQRMDDEFGNYKSGLENCLTRDGQNSASANIPLNGHKITGLAAGSADTDSASIVDARGFQSEWRIETNTVAWVDATHFKISTVNLAAIYNIPNRRVAITDNGVVKYGTIVSAVFGVDTTVLVVLDASGGALVGPVTAISYSPVVNSQGANSLLLRSYMRLRKNANLALAVATAQITGWASESDYNTEFAANAWTVRNTGRYNISVNLGLQTTNATNNIVAYMYRNGAVYEVMGRIDTGMVPTACFPRLPWTAQVDLAAGDVITFYYQSGSGGITILGNAVVDASASFVSINRAF